MVIESVEAPVFDRAKTFTMLGTPLLSEGRSMELIASAPQMWVHAKVYANGGERGLHSHPREDHLFFVLSGKATFWDENGETTEVGPYQGIMIPRGVLYAFESDGEESFVVLRVGAGGQQQDRTAEGAGGKPAKRPPRGVPIPERFFTAP